MGLLQSIGKRVAEQVAAIVARNELFERYGDRPVQPPLGPKSWTADGFDVAQASEDTGVVSTQLLGATAIKRAISTGPMVVNHWATWCESCAGENSALRELARRIDVPMVGISWDTFEGGTPEEALKAVRGAAEQADLAWEHLVVKGKAPHFFKVLGIKFKQIPQTWIVNAAGEVVHRIDGPIDAAEIDALVERVGAL